MTESPVCGKLKPLFVQFNDLINCLLLRHLLQLCLNIFPELAPAEPQISFIVDRLWQQFFLNFNLSLRFALWFFTFWFYLDDFRWARFSIFFDRSWTFSLNSFYGYVWRHATGRFNYFKVVVGRPNMLPIRRDIKVCGSRNFPAHLVDRGHWKSVWDLWLCVVILFLTSFGVCLCNVLFQVV